MGVYSSLIQNECYHSHTTVIVNEDSRTVLSHCSAVTNCPTTKRYAMLAQYRCTDLHFSLRTEYILYLSFNAYVALLWFCNAGANELIAVAQLLTFLALSENQVATNRLVAYNVSGRYYLQLKSSHMLLLLPAVCGLQTVRCTCTSANALQNFGGFAVISIS